jgi:hypothetical protein
MAVSWSFSFRPRALLERSTIACRTKVTVHEGYRYTKAFEDGPAPSLRDV